MVCLEHPWMVQGFVKLASRESSSCSCMAFARTKSEFAGAVFFLAFSVTLPLSTCPLSAVRRAVAALRRR